MNIKRFVLLKIQPKEKEKTFKDLEKWMGFFFAIARIALEDEPQLLESLGKFVRS